MKELPDCELSRVILQNMQERPLAKGCVAPYVEFAEAMRVSLAAANWAFNRATVLFDMFNVIHKKVQAREKRKKRKQKSAPKGSQGIHFACRGS